MRKLLVIAILSVFVTACTDVKETKEYKALQAERDSLTQVSSLQKDNIYAYLKDFNSIQENLQEIKKKENIINLNTNNPEELADKKEQINNDINSIYQLIQDNKEKIKSLNRKLRKSGIKNKEFKKMIAILNQQISEKNEEIQFLNTKLNDMDIQVKELTADLLDSRIENSKQNEVINEQEQKLATAYYVVGTQKELIASGIITKEGGFIGIGRSTKLDENIDVEKFTKINIKEFSEVDLYAKKAKLITTHLQGSYEWIGDDKKVDKLVIKSAEDFWKASKFLVIEVQN